MTSRAEYRSRWSDARNILLVNLVIALGITGLNLSISRWGGWAWLSEMFLANLIYANVIGWSAALVIPPVAIRVSGWTPRRRWPAYLGLLVAVGLLCPLLASGAIVLFGMAPPGAFWRLYRGSVGLAAMLVVVIGVVSYWLESLRYQAEATTRALREQQAERERAEKLAAEARLSSLESRLQPHFLFNTINSILSLIRDDPSGAEAMLERLSRLLRFALDSQQRGLVPLAEELRLVEDYLEIERARFGGRLRFNMEGVDGSGSVQLPAYAVQTLVENSMKFAVAPRRTGGEISVRVGRDGNALLIEVADDGPGFTREEMREGHGLDTLEKRLAVLYGGEARMRIGNGGQGARVCLQIPVMEAAG